MHPYEFLTLAPAEARLLVAALNGHLRTPGISARDAGHTLIWVGDWS